MTPALLAAASSEEWISVSAAGQWFLGLLVVIIITDRFLSVAVNCKHLFGKTDHLVSKTEMDDAFDSFQRGADDRQRENRTRLRRIEETLDSLAEHFLGKQSRNLARIREDEAEDEEINRSAR